MVIATPLPDIPEATPLVVERGWGPYTTSWPVRLADTDQHRRLRLDAIARYMQDIGFEHLDHTPDGKVHQGWVVRRNVIDVIRPIEFGADVTLRRWCAATSNRWCNMRVRIDGSDGGLVETEAFLIHFDMDSGLPARMSDAFLEPMLATTTEHRLRWKAALPTTAADDALTREYPLRTTDLDWLGHVNNAAYFAAVEDLVETPDKPFRTVVEYAKSLVLADDLTIASVADGVGIDAWFIVGDEVRASARVEELR
ncbi:acyl-[acyl-carrier-protein] thioesterase [Gordonia sp. TBRC 11910]|uniref:Acyl-[acyl-carrier-protein] thioesterase n=1 Tax=Gordonia asplenii TaxID=2725283 RepID=A0A848L4X6_9ACTN|nr:acyl-ACP thioesterase domain-containing protein [Gordonia asplenii]NMO02668.1 acyl-[acyl-carrier-protein] thioesterase [Gordonia asplenii]